MLINLLNIFIFFAVPQIIFSLLKEDIQKKIDGEAFSKQKENWNLFLIIWTIFWIIYFPIMDHQIIIR